MVSFVKKQQVLYDSIVCQDPDNVLSILTVQEEIIVD